jgi:hypothetical protein
LENRAIVIRYDSKSPIATINAVLTYTDVEGITGPSFRPGVVYCIGKTHHADIAKSRNATLSFENNGKVLKLCQASKVEMMSENSSSSVDISSTVKQIETQDIVCKCYIQASQLLEVFPSKRIKQEKERYFKVTPDSLTISGEIGEKLASVELKAKREGAQDYGFDVSPRKEFYGRLEMMGLSQFGKPLSSGSSNPVSITIFDSAETYKYIKFHVPFSEMSYGDIYLRLVPESRKASPQHTEEATMELQDFMTKAPDIIPPPLALAPAPPTITLAPIDETCSSTDKKPDLSLVDITGGANDEEEENIFLTE